MVAATSRRGGQRKLAQQAPLRRVVTRWLVQRWSPEQSVRRLQIQYGDDPEMQIAPEALYQSIYVLPRGELQRTRIAALRQERGWRRKKQRRSADNETRGKIADMVSIEERPAGVAERTVPGHWEGAMILGQHKRSALGTLVARTTRKTLLVRLGAQKDAGSVRQAYTRRMRRLPQQMAPSLTDDQGQEMRQHRQCTKSTGLTVYFAHPGCPWERGTNENTNGLIRQFFPQGPDCTKVSAHESRKVERRLNGRPRKTLHWNTPDDVFTSLLR